MAQPAFSSGPFSVSLTNGSIVVRFGPAPSGVWPAELGPELCRGHRADHLTIPFDLVGSKRGIHLTYPNKKWRTIKHVTQAGLDQFEAGMLEEAQRLLPDSIVPVGVEWLDKQGYALCSLSPALRAEIEARYKRPEHTRMNPGRLESWAENEAHKHIDIFPPDLLHSVTPAHGEHLQVVRSCADPPKVVGHLLFMSVWPEQPEGTWVFLSTEALNRFIVALLKRNLALMAPYARTALREMQADIPAEMISDLFACDHDSKMLDGIEQMLASVAA